MNQRSQQAHYGTPAAANDNEHPDRVWLFLDKNVLLQVANQTW